MQLIAFGSAATGDRSAANDLDLLVIQPHVSHRYQEMVRLHRVLRGLLMLRKAAQEQAVLEQLTTPSRRPKRC